MGSLFLDLKLVLRQLRKSAGFTLLAVLMLAFGIGATTAIFSIVNGVLLRPLPFPQPDRLVAVGDHLDGLNSDRSSSVTAPDIVAYGRDTHSFQSLGGYKNTAYELSGNGEPAQVNAARLGGGVFPALEVQPLLGRVFTVQEDEQHQQVAVLSYATWVNRFHSDPHILGTHLLLDRKPYIVIGVMPRDFEFPLEPGHLNRTELWVPLSLTPTELTEEASSWGSRMVGRLKPGVTIAQAQSDSERVAKEIMRNYPAYMASLHITAAVDPLGAATVADAKPLVRTLFLAVAVVLLIACFNLAGLLLVRAIRRQRELAVRLAIGAPAAALVRQALLESLVLSVAGGVLGISLAGVGLHAGKSLLPETLPRINEIALDWPVAAFALGLAVLTGLLCGLAPAFASLRIKVNSTLKDGGRSGSAGGGHARLRSALVVAEIAIALVLLTASGLLLRSFEKMRSVDLGFTPDHVTSAAYSLPRQYYSTQAAVDSFNKSLLDRLRALPGVTSVGFTTLMPESGSDSNQAFVVEGGAPQPGVHLNLSTPSGVNGDFFRAMGISLIRGRVFTDADRANSQLVVIVNRKLAEKFWPGQDPIGKHYRIGTQEMQTPWQTVVGEAEDVRQQSPDAEATLQAYYPASQELADAGSLVAPTEIMNDGGYLVVRSVLPPEQMENAIRSTVRGIDPLLSLSQLQTLTEAVSDSEAPRRFNTILISSFAFAAVVLAVLGIYGVIAFSVASRTQEIAIRMALGSRRGGIVALILRSGAQLAVIGCVIGLAGAAGASTLLRTMLFGVSPFDPAVLALAAVGVFALALAASAIPARRAATVDPIQALRGE
ncbi:ABC transporter permease [Silvibacterium sp.]|uniref:ABC transporter permease n=1 Tax=Silvibacterium sp. TaxID=1964179 RepID=UPI0039E57871